MISPVTNTHAQWPTDLACLKSTDSFVVDTAVKEGNRSTGSQTQRRLPLLSVGRDGVPVLWDLAKVMGGLNWARRRSLLLLVTRLSCQGGGMGRFATKLTASPIATTASAGSSTAATSSANAAPTTPGTPVVTVVSTAAVLSRTSPQMSVEYVTVAATDTRSQPPQFTTPTRTSHYTTTPAVAEAFGSIPWGGENSSMTVPLVPSCGEVIDLQGYHTCSSHPHDRLLEKSVTQAQAEWPSMSTAVDTTTGAIVGVRSSVEETEDLRLQQRAELRPCIQLIDLVSQRDLVRLIGSYI